MSNCNLYYILLAGSVLSAPAQALSSLSTTNHTHTTHTYTMVPEPASFIDMAHSFKTASICFLGVGDCDPNIGFGKGDDYSIDPSQQCINEGYVKVNCSAVQSVDTPCPYDSSYGKGCKCASNLVSCPSGQTGIGSSCGGKYVSCGCSSSLVSCASNQVGGGAYCGGKYEYCSCKSEYMYNSSNCSSPRSLSGSSCGGKYTYCSCPSGVSTGSFGCAEYYSSPCSSVCKKAKSDNCDARTAVSTPYGCMEYWSDCSSKCKTAYTDNCRNRTAVTCPYDCGSYFGDCQSKCASCTADNCANRTAVISSCPSNATCSYFSDCASKIQSWNCNSGYTKSGNTCINPCDNITAVTVPADATCSSYAAQCSSKCTAWTCNTGYVKSGDSCIAGKPSLTVHWSAPSPFKLVMLYAIKNCSASYTTNSCSSGTKITLGSLTGSYGTVEYTDLKIGDTLNLANGYGIVEGTTTGSDLQELETPTYVSFTESKNYSVNVRFGGKEVEEPIVPLAYVKEVYNIYGASRQSEFFPLFAAQRNTKLYTNYSNPERYGVTTDGADYSLRGTNSTTNLTLYYNTKPYAGLSGSGGGVAYCTASSITKNGSTIPLNNNGDVYVPVTRYVNEPEMTVVITYNCSVI